MAKVMPPCWCKKKSQRRVGGQTGEDSSERKNVMQKEKERKNRRKARKKEWEVNEGRGEHPVPPHPTPPSERVEGQRGDAEEQEPK